MDPKVSIGVEVIISRCHLLWVQQLGHLAPAWAAGLSGHMMDTLHRLGWDDRLRGLGGGTAHLKEVKGPGVSGDKEVPPSKDPLPSLSSPDPKQLQQAGLLKDWWLHSAS